MFEITNHKVTILPLTIRKYSEHLPEEKRSKNTFSQSGPYLLIIHQIKNYKDEAGSFHHPHIIQP